MLKQIPTVRTKLVPAEFIESLVKGWTLITGQTPKKESIGVIFSQWSLETGGNSCWCYNICNIKAVDDVNKIIEYCALNGVWEVVNGQKIILPITDPGSWFRAFRNLDDGVNFYLDFLKNHRYKKAWVSIENGKPADFSVLLKSLGYYTASVDDYTKSMNYFFNKFMKDNTFETVMLKLNPPAPASSQPSEVTDTDPPTTIIEQTVVATIDPIVINAEKPNFFQSLANFFKSLFSSR